MLGSLMQTRVGRTLGFGVAAVASLVLFVSPVAADPQAFQAVQGAATEEISGVGLMVAGYSVAWAIMLVFVLRVGWLHASTAGEVARLRQQLEAEGEGPQTEPREFSDKA